jgi:glycosyltransferase involved in cell wall biosynthesis
VQKVFREKLPEHKCHFLFIDNKSTDGTRSELRKLASKKNVSCIFNAQNFGPNRSAYHGMINTPGDAVIMMCADFQDPPEIIPALVECWSKGNKVVMAKKESSSEELLISSIRNIYYKALKYSNPLYASVQNCTGFGVYDREVIARLKSIRDPQPFFRGVIAEVSSDIKHVSYHRPERRFGISKMRFLNLWDEGVVGLINNSKFAIRLITLTGSLISTMSFLTAFFYLAVKLIYWDAFPLGIAPLIIIQLFLIGFLMVFIGILGEYIGAIYTQVLDRDRVFEEERLNLD